jgi:hypothetical protein
MTGWKLQLGMKLEINDGVETTSAEEILTGVETTSVDESRNK